MKEEPRVAVSAGLPTSLVGVGLAIAEANGWEFVRNPFDVIRKKDKYDRMVYVTDNRFDTVEVGRQMPVNHVIFYLVSEGPVRTNITKFVNKHYVVAPTNFVKDMLERKGVRVDAVIPHGIHIPEKVRPVSEKNGFFYRAYYIPRKYPSYGLKALEEYVKRHGSDGIDIYLVGPPHFPKDLELKTRFSFMKMKNPIPSEEMAQLYDTHLFYLNFSDAEGFGLTPLEAMSYGEIVITPYYPAIRDYLPVDCNIAVGVKSYWLERLDYEYILHAEYDPKDFLKAMEIAREMAEGDRKELERWSYCNRETAKKYDYKYVYGKVFREFVLSTLK